MAFWIEPASWGYGYAAEAAHCAVRYGFKVLSVKNIWAGVALWNQASGRVLEKLGMVYMRENPAVYQINGEPVIAVGV